MDYVLRKQLRQILTYTQASAIDYAGNQTYGTAATCFARIEPYHREIPVGSDVIEERTKHMVILDPKTYPLTQAQTTNANFTLPGETAPRRPKIVHYCYGETGKLEHIEVVV